MLKHQHHNNRHQQSQRIEHHAGVEIRLLPIHSLGGVNSLLTSIVSVKGKQHGNEESRHHHITQTENAKCLSRVVSRSRQHLGEDKLDGSLHARGNLDHHFRSKHPENVVEEKTSHQQETGVEGTERLGGERLITIIMIIAIIIAIAYKNSNANSKDIISNPMRIEIINNGKEEGNRIRNTITKTNSQGKLES